jgi:transcriptional regulator with XRE-family HTH domain
MTPTEFRQYLHGLGLNQQHVSALVGVQDRTVRRWASGRISVPEDVHEMLIDLDNDVTQAVGQILKNKKASNDFSGIPVKVEAALQDTINRRVAEAKRLRKSDKKGD